MHSVWAIIADVGDKRVAESEDGTAGESPGVRYYKHLSCRLQMTFMYFSVKAHPAYTADQVCSYAT